MRYQRPKGTTDILPGESERWTYVENVARRIFAKYRFNEIRTPIFERFDVFSRTSGETSDIVTKEMYDFMDKGDRHVSLRPEGTAGVVRAFIENKFYGPNVPKPVKMYYMGPMFRYERPQSGRMREFHQIGVEVLGSNEPAIDVETMAMGLDLITKLGIKNVRLVVNTLGDQKTRTIFRQKLIDYLKPHFNELSDESKVRIHKNPLRILDSKDATDQKIIANAPSILDYLTADAQLYFDQVKNMLDALDIDYVIDSTMVRGLDYYNHIIFEFMAQDKILGHGYTTICAGGRYNGLVEELGGPDIAGIGFAIGVERLLLLMTASASNFPESPLLDAYVVGIGTHTDAATLKIVTKLRAQDFVVDRDYLNRKIKAQFKSADKFDARYTLTMGEIEFENKMINVKNMASGNEVTVPIELVENDFNDVIYNIVGGITE